MKLDSSLCPIFWTDIPQFTRSTSNRTDIFWSHLQRFIQESINEDKLELDPDFQRGHVWTEKQQIQYVEYALQGGMSGRDIYTNCPNWGTGKIGNYVLVDGKQRLTAALKFLDNKLPIFGNNYYKDFKGKLGLNGPSFIWHINDLPTRAEVLKWYIEMNSNMVCHTEEEINKVKIMLDKESKENRRQCTAKQSTGTPK